MIISKYKKERQRQKKSSIYVLYILFFFSALSGHDITVHIINPNNTDSNIRKNLTKHHVYLPSSSKHYKNKLLVFLPGTGAKPSDYNEFNTLAATLGFHVISLSYVNRQKLFKLCSKKPKGCYEKTCREIIDGTDRTPDIDIKPVNSIENRLLKLLKYLNHSYPNQSWDQFYDQDNILWHKIILAGHSQGGEHAGIIAKYNDVHRVIFFNSPNGIIVYPNKRHELAAWINNNNKTEAKNYYAFYHKANAGRRLLLMYRTLSMLKFGPEVRETKITTPGTTSHVVFSNFKTDNPHSAIIMDKYLPSDSSTKKMIQDAWQYLLLHNDETTKKLNVVQSKIIKKTDLPKKAKSGNKIEDLPLLYIGL